MEAKQTKKIGRPKGRKDSKPRKKRKKKVARTSARARAKSSSSTASASVTPSEPAGVTVHAELGDSETVPYPTAGDNPAFADFLRTELGDSAGTGGGAGTPAAQTPALLPAGSGLTPEWFADAYRFLGRKWAEALKDKSMDFQPYEIKALVPPSVTVAQKYLGTVNPYDVCVYELCVVATVIFGPRLTRTVNVAMERFTGRSKSSSARKPEKEAQKPSDRRSDRADDDYRPQEL